MITWSASFTFLAMQKFWPNAAVRRCGRTDDAFPRAAETVKTFGKPDIGSFFEDALMALIGTVHYEVRDGVALLTIDNPPVNPLSSGVRFYLSQHMETATADASVKAIVITGKGRAFIAGADIRDFGKPPVCRRTAEASSRRHHRRKQKAGDRRDQRHRVRRRPRICADVSLPRRIARCAGRTAGNQNRPAARRRRHAAFAAADRRCKRDERDSVGRSVRNRRQRCARHHRRNHRGRSGRRRDRIRQAQSQTRRHRCRWFATKPTRCSPIAPTPRRSSKRPRHFSRAVCAASSTARWRTSA